MAGEPRALDQLRSGLCHGPSCEQKITEKSESRYFCSEGCQGRWAAAVVGVTPEPYRSAAPRVIMPVCTTVTYELVEPPVEALRPVDLSLGARHHLTGGEYVVTLSDGRNATLTPIEVLPKPIRRSWWKPNTWRRT
jgi:endogenous inhibitor of DNA gyrase (YacG/DUF329 family)